MDRNSLIGFGLLLLLLIGYIFYNRQSEQKYLEQKRIDSLEQVKKNPPAAVLPAAQKLQRAVADSSVDSTVVSKPESLHVIENQELQLTLSSKGGLVKKVWLKKFKTYDGKPLILLEGTKNYLDLGFKSLQGGMVHSKELDFDAQISSDQRTLTFQHPQLNITYQLPETGYMVQLKNTLTQADLSAPMNLQWNAAASMTERDIESQRLNARMCYNLDKEGYDYFTIGEKEDKNFTEKLKWLSFKQHYFNSTLIPEQPFITSCKITSSINKTDTAQRALADMSTYFTLNAQKDFSFKLYLGPNDYKLLKSYKLELEELIPLSYGIFGFVKYINVWIIIPIFNWLAGLFSSYGVVILLLTFIIRLLMSPFTYKSYVSSAKMKALKPEMDALREKLGEDKQAFGMEQMKLYRQAGVNPLGGCLPALLQLPVFFALLSFFPHAIELRQSKFLWAHDLSTYDSILDLPFTIPFYGNHISLFTLLFVITSLLMALYSMNMAADQSNPMMKYLPFIMPVMFLGIFNKLPAALTFYYFVSNVITLGLQFVIQNWIIDPDKIHAQIQAKKNEAPKENKLMKRMMEMQKQNEERMKKAGKK